MASDREKEWANLAKKRNISDNDIANLNDGETFSPKTDEERVPLTEEEKRKIRKTLFILLIFIGIFWVVLIIFFIFPVGKKNDNPIVEEKKEEVVDKDETEKDETSLAIFELGDGIVPENNVDLQRLKNEILYKVEEYYDTDTSLLYKNDVNVVTGFNDSNKLFLMTKTSDFNELITNSIKDNNLCETNIIVAENDIQKILKNRFNTEVNGNNSFISSYYGGNGFISNIKFTKNGTNYVGTCYQLQTDITSVSEQEYVQAIKTGNELYIDVKIAFINKTGVYKDPEYKTLITNDKTKTSVEYMPKANTYRYVFDMSQKNYLLTQIQLLK